MTKDEQIVLLRSTAAVALGALKALQCTEHQLRAEGVASIIQSIEKTLSDTTPGTAFEIFEKPETRADDKGEK